MLSRTTGKKKILSISCQIQIINSNRKLFDLLHNRYHQINIQKRVGAYKDIFMNEEKEWLMKKHENLLERQHANKGKAFSFGVVLIFVVEYNKALLIPTNFHSTSSSPQYSFFFDFNPQSFSITLYCADICLYICRLNKKKRSTFRTFHVEWSVTELRERRIESIEMWKEIRRLGGW